MNIAVTIWSRSSVDQDFAQLVAPVVLTMTGPNLGWTPTLPPGSDALELRLRVFSPEAVKVMVGYYLDPAHPPQPTPIYDENLVQIGETPAPTPMVMSAIGIWDGQTGNVPFRCRESFVFCRVGAWG